MAAVLTVRLTFAMLTIAGVNADHIRDYAVRCQTWRRGSTRSGDGRSDGTGWMLGRGSTIVTPRRWESGRRNCIAIAFLSGGYRGDEGGYYYEDDDGDDEYEDDDGFGYGDHASDRTTSKQGGGRFGGFAIALDSVPLMGGNMQHRRELCATSKPYRSRPSFLTTTQFPVPCLLQATVLCSFAAEHW
jgi:hypothetical protein